MHSLNQAVLGHVVAAERADRTRIRAVSAAATGTPAQYALARPGGLRHRPAGAPPGPRDGPPRSDLSLSEKLARGTPRSISRGPVEITRLEHRESFITADGSSIRELAGIPSGNSVNQSLAEATVPPSGETFEHYHRVSEEIY